MPPRNKYLRFPFSTRGDGLLGPVVGTTILVGALTYFGASQYQNSLQVRRLTEEEIAQGYATELLEFFRSFKASRLKTYLSKNPNCPATGSCNLSLSPYKLCSHINLQDRISEPKDEGGNSVDKLLLINQDSIADLPSPNPLDGTTSKTKANRYYQIFVANVLDNATDGVTINPQYCNDTAATIISLGSTERFLVTVGVSWVTKTQKTNNVRRIALSTVIPN